MDVLVMLEENVDQPSVLAHVSSVPSPLHAEQGGVGRSRDVVTLYGAADAESLALALAAAVESHRVPDERWDTIRHLGVWKERGAVGDTAWRDVTTGQLMTRDVDIPAERLRATAGELLSECGQLIRRLAAGLSMPDWPEGARRAINITLTPVAEVTAAVRAGADGFLDMFREADGLAYDSEGD
ncbi:MAG: hypothetical protein ACJ79S_21945 [Gemmatimonadaceae bacterium]